MLPSCSFFYSSARDYKIQFFYFIPISLGLILASEASYNYDYIYVSCHVKMCNQKSAIFFLLRLLTVLTLIYERAQESVESKSFYYSVLDP